MLAPRFQSLYLPHPVACRILETIGRLAIVGLLLGNPVLQARIKSERMLKAIIAQTPAPQLVAEGQQLKIAEFAAAQIPGAMAYWGIGRSMEPLYATNTAVVVAPIAYADVKKGMTLVYMKSNGRRVAHTVVGEIREGYLVQGVCNDEPDAGVVNDDNLIGVIVSAYATTNTPFRVELAQRLTARDSVRIAKSG